MTTDIKKYISDASTPKSNLEFYNINAFEDHYVLIVDGGLNGSGNWKDYLFSLTRLFEILDANNLEAWVIDMKVDCLDDVFRVEIGINRFHK